MTQDVARETRPAVPRPVGDFDGESRLALMRRLLAPPRRRSLLARILSRLGVI